MFFDIKLIKIKILIFIIYINKYLFINIFKFYSKFLKTQNFDLWNLVTSQDNKVKTSYLLIYLKLQIILQKYYLFNS